MKKFYDEFAEELEASIGPIATVREWWAEDRERLISHMVGAGSAIARIRGDVRPTRDEVLRMLEFYLDVPMVTS